MAGLLPGTRPLSENYGPDMVDEKPLENPELELPADNFNKLKADVAYAARMSALLRVKVTNSGTPAVAAVMGPEGVVVGDVAVTDNGPGDTTVDVSGVSGLVVSDVRAQAHWNGVDYTYAITEVVSATTVRVRTYDPNGPSLADCDFTLWID